MEFISCRDPMQHQLIFPSLDRRVFFALILREYENDTFSLPQTEGHFKTKKKHKRVIFLWKFFRRPRSLAASYSYCSINDGWQGASLTADRRQLIPPASCLIREYYRNSSTWDLLLAALIPAVYSVPRRARQSRRKPVLYP